MRELYKISFLPNEYNCFFYLNEKNLRQFSNRGSLTNCIKIQFCTNLSFFTYSFITYQASSVLSDEHIGVNAIYAQLLGLKEGDEVLITGENAKLLTRVNVVPKNKHDYELVVKYFDYLENSILNQVKVVTLGQVIPIQIHSNVIIRLEIESLEPEVLFGDLQESTELVVKDVQEIRGTGVFSPHTVNESVVETEHEHDKSDNFNFSNTNEQTWAKSESGLNGMTGCLEKKSFSLNNFLSGFIQFWKRDNSQPIEINEEDKMPKICFCKDLSTYRVNTGLVLDNEFLKSIGNKFIIVKRLPVSKKVDGPCCFKIFCKVQKVEGQIKELGFGEYLSYSTFAYVVNLSDCEDESDNDVYLPDSLLKILNLRIGCYVKIEEVKRKKELMDQRFKNTCVIPSGNYINCNLFTEEMKQIYESTINTIINNLKFKDKINTLIVGGTGTGKSYLLDSLTAYFEEKLIYFKRIDCKKLRRVKVATLIKLFNTVLPECCSFQPSILFIDDLDALLIDDDQENRYKTLYSERIGNLLSSNISSYQNLNNISIVATISSLSKIKYICTDRGPTMFENIFEISELDETKRSHVLKCIISQKYSNYRASFIDYVASKTKGYNIQDLYDLVELAVFKAVARTRSYNYKLEKVDFESALSEKVPLSLYGVKLSKNTRTNWNDVGGLEEPKKLLKEMFEWPLKYREVYQSCPLRLQCGVLLYGAPGTGKTLIASAVARECGLNFISIKGPEIFSKYVGASEQGVRDLFTRARKAKPCLLFFDEFDSLALRRGSSNEDVNDRVVNQILTELDGVEELTGVFILAATSRPDLLDPALLRPGRIDKTIHCGLPKKEERLSILKALSKPLRLSDDVDFEEIAARTSGYTGADLHAVLYAAQTALVKEIDKEHSVQNNELVKITKKHLFCGLAATKPSISKEEIFKYQAIYENFTSSRMGGVIQRSQETAGKIMFA